MHERFRSVLAIIVACAATGCTPDQIQRFGFNLGEQHRCMQDAEHTANESMKDLDCMTPGPERDRAWEEYQRARDKELEG